MIAADAQADLRRRLGPRPARPTAGGRTQSRKQRNGVHNGAQDYTRIHFGLGSSTTVQSLEIAWPSGVRQTVYDLPADQILRIVEGKPWSTPFALQPSAQYFGTQALFTSETRSFKLANSGIAALPIVNI